MAKKPTTDTPRISVLERRLQNPFGEPSGAIAFKAKNIMARWFSQDVRNDQIYRARKELGWLPVTMDMVEDPDSIGAYEVSAENKITRGERGKEVLMWMPADQYKQIQMAKTRINLERARDYRGEQKQILEEMGKTLGDERATKTEVALRKFQEIHENYEVMQRTPEQE